jgi:D-lactate dehydrogenase (cytochrome)
MIIKTDSELIQNYLTDASNIKGNADVVYIPETINEIKPVLAECKDKKIPVWISGAGTGMVSGRVPEGGAMISMEKLNKILEIDGENMLVRVEPGIPLVELQKELESQGFLYPPNPTEINSFIGGNVATNASGSKTFKYGSTRDYVQKLKIILADGDELILERGRQKADGFTAELVTESGKKIKIELPEISMPDCKNTSGYYSQKGMDLVDLFIGSEGTLGVVAEITLKILPNPANIIGGICYFDDLDKLISFVEDVRDSSKDTFDRNYTEINGVSFRLIEYFDKNSLKMLKGQYSQIPEKALGAIWFEQEYSQENEDEILGEIYSKIEEYTPYADDTWIALTDNEHENLRKFRHALPLTIDEKLVSSGQRKFGTDTATPVKYFREYFNSLHDISEKSGLEYAIWGHIGNSHLHSNLFMSNENDFEKARETYAQLMKKSTEMEGTISAEHGIGKLKKNYLNFMYSDDKIQQMKEIKKALDPNLILSKGVLFDFD